MTTPNLPTIFDFTERNSVRVVPMDDGPWFVAADVCRVLNMDVSRGAYRWLVNIPDEDKNTHRDSSGGRGNPNVTIISEAGLYLLLLRSNKPEAKPFQDWVTRVVLPAIRKDGGYVLGEEKVSTGEIDAEEIVDRAQEALRRKIERRRAEKEGNALADRNSAIVIDHE